MSPAELLAECERKQLASGRDDVGVYLTTPSRRVGYSGRIRLFGRYGPLGEVLNVHGDGRVTGIWPADAIIRAIKEGVALMLRPLAFLAALMMIAAALFTTHEARAGLSGREMLTSSRTYYVRTDGNDTNACMTDSAVGACRSWQRAIDLATMLDFNGMAVTIQAGNEGGPRTWTVGNVVQTQTGGGTLTFIGSPTPGWTTFNVVGADVFLLFATGTQVVFSDMTLIGGASGLIQSAYNSRAFIGNGVVFGPAAFAHLYVHDAQAEILMLGAADTILGGAGYHLFVNGGMAFVEASTMTIVGAPAFPGGFAAALNGGRIQTVSTTFIGSSTGPRFRAEGNGIINSFGGGPSYFPGSTPGNLSSGGQYL